MITKVYEEALTSPRGRQIALRVEQWEEELPFKLVMESFAVGGGAFEVALTLSQGTSRTVVRNAAFDADVIAMGRELFELYAQMTADVAGRLTLVHVVGLSLRWSEQSELS